MLFEYWKILTNLLIFSLLGKFYFCYVDKFDLHNVELKSSLHNHGDQKQSCPRHNTKNLEQIHWKQFFCGIYGLAEMLSISKLTTSKDIDEKTEFRVHFSIE